MLHNLLNILQPYPPQGEFTEIQKYDEGRRILEKTMREKGGMEYYLISKKFIKQWKYYVDYYEEMENQPRDQRPKPDQINSDLVSDEKVFKYIPEDHVYNSTLRFLENEWDYEYIVKGVFQAFQEKYQCNLLQVRIGFYDDNIKRKQIYANLARFTLMYWSPKDNKLITTLAQVDYNSEIKSWTELLKTTFQENLKPTLINNIRIWQPRHKNFQTEIQIEQIIKTKQIDGIILQDYSMIFQLKSLRDSCLILDFQLNDWQFTQLSPQLQLKYDVELVFNRAINGCGRFICDFPICQLNNNYKALELENDDIHGICQELIQNEEINWDLFCPKNLDQKIAPLQRKNIEGNKQALAPLINQLNADTFGASFVENYNKTSIYPINLENADIDIDALKLLQDYFLKNKGEINKFIQNLFLLKEKKFESLTNLYQLRAIFLILQFRQSYETFLEEKQYTFLKIIKRLEKKEKHQLAKWFKISNHKELEESVKICQKVIKQEIIRLSMKSVPFLEIDDASKLQCIFELLSILYKSNKMNTRINPSTFIIENVSKLYKEDADKEEFSQFRYYTSKYWKNYSFTFCLYPWVIPIEFKNKLLSLDSRVKQQDSLRNYSRYELFLGQIPYLSLQVDRANIIDSALSQLQKSNIPLKNPLKVQFIGEQGVDEGGPKREFFRLLMEKLITQDYGMFIPKNNNTVFWFNPKSFEMPIFYSFIGKLLGLALYNQVLLDVRFPTVIFKKLQGEKLTAEDVKELDMETYSSFAFIREASEIDLQILAQTFNVTYTVWGEIYYEDLKPNGFSINVTQENREEFIQLYIDWYLNKSVKSQFDLFYSGFKSVVDGDGIKLFTGEELQQLIIGLPNFDLKDLEAITKYDGYDEKSEYIKYFWNYIHSLNQEMQKRFLFFCTGTDRIPVGGLKSIKFVIQKHGEGTFTHNLDTEQLPSAHTCFNVLLLPQYKKKETLKEKFKISLENAEGFGLM